MKQKAAWRAQFQGIVLVDCERFAAPGSAETPPFKDTKLARRRRTYVE